MREVYNLLTDIKPSIDIQDEELDTIGLERTYLGGKPSLSHLTYNDYKRYMEYLDKLLFGKWHYTEDGHGFETDD